MIEVAPAHIIVTAIGLAATAILLVVFLPRTREKSRRVSDLRERRRRQVLVEQLLDARGKCSVDEVVSRAEHDLNNLWLALSMEADRLRSADTSLDSWRTTIDTMTQLVGEGRQIVGALSAYGTDDDGPAECCDVIKECQLIAEFWGGSAGGGPLIESVFDDEQLPILCNRAPEFRLLALELCSVATEFVEEDDARPLISIGNGNRGEVRFSVTCQERVAESEGQSRLSRLGALAERMSGEFYLHSGETESASVVISIPAALSNTQ